MKKIEAILEKGYKLIEMGKAYSAKLITHDELKDLMEIAEIHYKVKINLVDTN